jgi:oxygen-dependent protoporphyrinogen oxidase
MKPVAIIGGGITGLTAAFKLHRQNVPVVLYEAGNRVGGVIQSIRHDGYLAENGPNSILETSPVIGGLIDDLNLQNRRLYSDERSNKRFLIRNRKPVPLPCSFWGFLSTPLFSTGAKLRLFAEPFIPRSLPAREESLAQFVVRRLGHEFLDYAINPFVAGVYAGDPAHLSVRHAFPKLYDLEQRYGSLIKGQVLGSRQRKRRAEVSKQNAKKLSFDEGLQVLPDALAVRLRPNIRLNSPVQHLERRGQEWIIATRGNQNQVTSHSAVIYAAPPLHLPEIRLVDRYIDYSPLSKIYYPPVATLVLGFRREDVAHPLDGFGMLIPEVEGFNILGTLFSSSLFPNRAPSGHVTLTSYIGGARAPHMAESDLQTLINLTLQDLRVLLGVKGQPTFVHHALFRHAIPQYDVGYGRFKNLMTEIEQKAPGLFFAGHYRDGIALSDSIVSGDKAANRVRQFLDSPEAHPIIPSEVAA